MPWETVIGIETHVQLATHSKIFSGSSTQFGAPANTQANAVDLGLPGVLPVLNRGAVERAIQFGLAVGATIAPISVFARKNYFYPDLPKGYQISQFEQPIVIGGCLSFGVKSEIKTVHLTRAHLEEDAGKSLHEDYQGMTGIDLNRAGTPLLEIVTEPEMRSAAEAVAYAKALHALVVWLGICDGNMQEGSFRCDANVSVRPLGQTTLGTRCEIKNLNSFRFLEEAIQYEVSRQQAIIEDGGRVRQETRLFDPDQKETRTMRSKEDSQDYRYFPDPDLPPLVIAEDWIDRIAKAMPELPAAMRERFKQAYALSDDDVLQLTQSPAMAQYFEDVMTLTASKDAKGVVNWLMGDMAAMCSRTGIDMHHVPVRPAQCARLLQRIVDGSISHKIAKDVFTTMWETCAAGVTSDASLADEIIEKQGLKQISDNSALEKIVDDVLQAHASFVEEFRAGKEKAFNALIGAAMKASRGRANPAQLTALLKRKTAAVRNALSSQTLRIIGGRWKRTPLNIVAGVGVRPTLDRVRETVFNWLTHLTQGQWETCRCLDLFAGSGALGFEAASRGAQSVVMVEHFAPAVTQLLAHQMKLGAYHVHIHRSDALHYLRSQIAMGTQRFEVIFLDPPYHHDWLANLLPLCAKILAPTGWVYVECEFSLVSLVASTSPKTPAWMEGWTIHRADRAGKVFYHLVGRI